MTEEISSSKYQPGDMLWGRVSGHPWWPCMVAIGPDSPSHFRTIKRRQNTQVQYHVQYFGEENERGWVSEVSLMPYEGRATFEKMQEDKLNPNSGNPSKKDRQSFVIAYRRQKGWSSAVVQAEAALALTCDERKNGYTFAYPVVSAAELQTSKMASPKKRKRRGSSLSSNGINSSLVLQNSSISDSLNETAEDEMDEGNHTDSGDMAVSLAQAGVRSGRAIKHTSRFADHLQDVIKKKTRNPSNKHSTPPLSQDSSFNTSNKLNQSGNLPIKTEISELTFAHEAKKITKTSRVSYPKPTVPSKTTTGVTTGTNNQEVHIKIEPISDPFVEAQMLQQQQQLLEHNQPMESHFYPQHHQIINVFPLDVEHHDYESAQSTMPPNKRQKLTHDYDHRVILITPIPEMEDESPSISQPILVPPTLTTSPMALNTLMTESVARNTPEICSVATNTDIDMKWFDRFLMDSMVTSETGSQTQSHPLESGVDEDEQLMEVDSGIDSIPECAIINGEEATQTQEDSKNDKDKIKTSVEEELIYGVKTINKDEHVNNSTMETKECNAVHSVDSNHIKSDYMIEATLESSTLVTPLPSISHTTIDPISDHLESSQQIEETCKGINKTCDSTITTIDITPVSDGRNDSLECDEEHYDTKPSKLEDKQPISSQESYQHPGGLSFYNNSQQNDNNSQQNDNHSQHSDNNSQQNDNNSQQDDNNSQKHDNTSQQDDNNSQKHDNTSQQNDTNSQQNDNNSQQNDNNSQQNDNTSQQDYNTLSTNSMSSSSSQDDNFEEYETKNNTKENPPQESYDHFEEQPKLEVNPLYGVLWKSENSVENSSEEEDEIIPTIVPNKPRRICHHCECWGDNLVTCQGPCHGMYHASCIGVSSPSTGPIKCKQCTTGCHQCFICKATSVDLAQCSVQDCGKFYHRECLSRIPLKGMTSNPNNATLSCPRHTCLTCIMEVGKITTRITKGAMYKCIKCPRSYHVNQFCLPASCQIMGGHDIICSAHLNSNDYKNCAEFSCDWCAVCFDDDNYDDTHDLTQNRGKPKKGCRRNECLLTCSTCPLSFHPSCYKVSPSTDAWSCKGCLSGKRTCYGDVVWAKMSNYRWWPGRVLLPNEFQEKNCHLVSNNVNPGDVVVKFYGLKLALWVPWYRLLRFEDGEHLAKEYTHRHLMNFYDLGTTLASEIHEKRVNQRKSELPIDQKSLSKPSPYRHIKINIPLGDVEIIKAPPGENPSCSCIPDDQGFYCGPDSDCINRLMLYECHPMVCHGQDKCLNQRFTKRQDANIKPLKTQEKGWGVFAQAPVEKGQFIGEYVGDLINSKECTRRLEEAQVNGIKNFYMLTLDKNRIIDAGPKGNFTRFMNHCCEPNCETQKWTVCGDIRVGLFALKDISGGMELNFNYNLDCFGNEKTRCKCGSTICSGFLGVRPKTAVAVENERKSNETKLKREKSLPNPQHKKRGRKPKQSA